MPEPISTDVLHGRHSALEPLYDQVRALFTWGWRVGALVLVVGVVLALARGEPPGASIDPVGEILPTVLSGSAAGLIDLAILWFMILPVLATIVVAVGFARLGDRRYALISLLVLIVLGFSITLALAR
ncbi:MAG: DUF1634 domain-containing protein [Thermomicrobiales bacterium]|nr:DUF1634 domain-containing protein [Thermomicrobiales bacterium]